MDEMKRLETARNMAVDRKLVMDVYEALDAIRDDLRGLTAIVFALARTAEWAETNPQELDVVALALRDRSENVGAQAEALKAALYPNE